MIQDIKELYKYREMLKNLVRKDLRTRYKGSFLGFLWTFINPFMQLIVYSVIFSTIMKINISNYSMFLFVVLLPWTFFSSSLLSSTASIVNNKDLVKKVYFPREILPIAVTTSSFMNLLFGFIIVFPCLLATRVHLTLNVLYLPLILIIEYLLVLAFSIIISALNVYFRDLEHILGILMMGWFYFTPIIFPIEMIPHKYISYFFINPMTPISTAFRDILFYGSKPNLTMLGIIGIASIFFLIFSHQVFHILEKNFAEEI